MACGFINDIRNLVSFTGALKNLKICTLRDFSVQEINVELKLQRSYVVKLKGDAIFKEKLTDCLKDDIRNFVNFHGNSRKSENLHFHGLLLSIGSKVLAKKVLKSYLSRRWRVIQTWTFCLKNDMRNLVNFSESSWKSEGLHCDGLLLSKVCSVWVKKI